MTPTPVELQACSAPHDVAAGRSLGSAPQHPADSTSSGPASSLLAPASCQEWPTDALLEVVSSYGFATDSSLLLGPHYLTTEYRYIHPYPGNPIHHFSRPPASFWLLHLLAQAASLCNNPDLDPASASRSWGSPLIGGGVTIGRGPGCGDGIPQGRLHCIHCIHCFLGWRPSTSSLRGSLSWGLQVFVALQCALSVAQPGTTMGKT